MSRLVLIEFEEFKAFAGSLIQEEIRKALYPHGQSDTDNKEPFLMRNQMAKATRWEDLPSSIAH